MPGVEVCRDAPAPKLTAGQRPRPIVLLVLRPRELSREIHLERAFSSAEFQREACRHLVFAPDQQYVHHWRAAERARIACRCTNRRLLELEMRGVAAPALAEADLAVDRD